MRPSRLPTMPPSTSEQPKYPRLRPTPVVVPPRHRPVDHEPRTRTIALTPSHAS
jgi:hypothetical protein